ncbi:hypothetical protein [Cohnella hashimotonis]|uniref:Uncharacterized protein n=1 Tax=Cohnella hashimotonis TaxID=2826895 RepID=A0ABT6TVC1_9BACL|nr:hypothetical protein [Cohnella hashimotonis]MDI4649737.1 hypothetical protein [Cohnella hashimotonis]
MLLAACAKEDPAMRKGCKALCLSADLQVNRAFGVPSLLMFVAVCGLRFAVCGLRFAVCGLRFAVCGLRIEKLHLYRYFSAEQRMR